MSYYSNPTANAAIGAVDKELNMMRKKAKRLAALRRAGKLSPEEELRQRRQFVGIYKRLLQEAFEDKPTEQRERLTASPAALEP